MERKLLVHNFARRLTILMQQLGLQSQNSKAGVKISKLAEISGCSHQMARRYALGEALPDIDTTYKIAKWLKVSPGWLVFGDEGDVPNNLDKKNLAHIDPELLEYILLKSAPLYSMTNDIKELTSFVIDIINDATHIEADRTTIIKIVDISINSAIRFKGNLNDKRTKKN